MEDRKKHIDDLFREGLNDYREVPDNRVWAALEQRLTEADDSATEKPSRRWLWLLLLLLLLGTIGYFVFTHSAEKSNEQKNLNKKIEHTFGSNTERNMETPGTGSNDFDGSNGNRPASSISNNSSHKALQSATMPGTASTSNRNASRTDNYVSHRTSADGKATATDRQGTREKSRSAKTERAGQTSTTNNRAARAARADRTTADEAAGKLATTTGKKANASTASSEGRRTKANNIALTTQNGHGKGTDDHADQRTESSDNTKTTKSKSGTLRERKRQATNNAAVAEGTKEPSMTGNNNVRTRTVTGKGSGGTTASNRKTQATVKSTTTQAESAAIANERKQSVNQMRDNEKSGEKVANENPITSNQALVEKEALSESGLYVPPADRRKAKTDNHPQLTKTRKSKQTPGASESNKNLSAEGTEDEGEPIKVLAATGSRENVEVNGASFGSKQPDEVNPAKFKKSKLVVTTTEPAVKRTEDERSTTYKPKKPEVTKTEKFTVNNEEEKPEKTENAKMYLATAKSEVPVATTADNSSAGGGGGGSATDVKPAKPKTNQFRFDLGVKAGYEKGFADVTQSSFIFAPFLQWNISPRVSFVLQPGFRYNQVNKSDIFNMTATYHQITSATRDSFNNYITDTSGQVTDVQRNYLFKHVYDSIVFNRRLVQKKYWEIELPIMLRYKIASNFAIFGGLSLTFGNLLKLDDGKMVFNGLQKTDSLSFPSVPINAPGPTLPAAASYFSYNTPDASTAPAASVIPASNPARFGIMFGFSYELQRRIMIDVMYKQTVSDMRYIPNEQMRKIYTQPYLRVMLGLKLFESKKPVVSNPAGL